MKQAVVIIGAGGLGLAITLYPIVIDNNLERSRFTKAITMQPRTLEIADSFGLLKEFLSRGLQAKKSVFYVKGISVSKKQKHVNLKEVENTKKGVCSWVAIKASHPSPCPPCFASNIFVEIDPCSELYARMQKSPLFLVISPDRYVFETYASIDWHTMLNHMNTLIHHEENCEDIRNEPRLTNKYSFNFDLYYHECSKKNRRSL